MKKWLLFPLFLTFFLPSLSASSDQHIEAVVNGHPITTLDIKKRLVLTNQYGEIFQGGPRSKKEQAVWNKMREELIEEQLLLSRARQAGITLNSKDRKKIEGRVQAMVEKAGSLSTLKIALQKRGITIKDVRNTVAHQILIRRFILKNLSSELYVIPGEIKGYYQRAKRRFEEEGKLPEGTGAQRLFFKASLKIRQIQVWREPGETDTEARQRAVKCLAALREGKSFDWVAKKFLASSRAQKKGTLWKLESAKDLGDQSLQKALKNLKEGEMSGIISTSFGFAIVKVMERTPTRLKPFYKIQDKIRSLLRRQRYYKTLKRFKKRLKKQALIKRYKFE